ncbi:MAG: FKBP-type 22 kDa peptidyl-prolyl cis-trans isomerase [Candidatus Ordinivivax streblomastigis]|uniref:Peptidyl-prolyl cis-trans isomerase n=1 Tax=Candidatus Ordinivivax streblomastigis TaxID=2540710 RepID=A0A5M8P4Z4_9BACT|nr:MAG: FKBP-type 22 kDa peptidyl-prolyl cis-trans isomerase [Candidatus Ordinivivax streblomastigis]
MKKLFSVSFFSLVVFAGVALFSCNAQAPKANLKTDVDTLSYAVGVNIASSPGFGYALQEVDSAYMSEFFKGVQTTLNADPKNKKAVAYATGQKVGQQLAQMVIQMNQSFFGEDSTQTVSKKNLYAGIVNTLLKKNLLISADSAQFVVQTLAEKKEQEAMEKQYGEVKKANVAFLETNKTKEGVITLPSGLQYKVITEGTGAKPTATDKVKVHYHGTNINGEVFDSSVDKGTPVEFVLNQVIKGWTEGLQLMPVGSKYILYVPSDLGYGAQPQGEKISAFATLIFEVELLEIEK